MSDKSHRLYNILRQTEKIHSYKKLKNNYFKNWNKT